MSRKILLIYTGGTIGMQPSDRGYVPIKGFESLIRERLAHSHHAALPDFDFIELDPLIDSANLTPTQWNQIAAEVIQYYNDYDGFIVLHGTDTMAYSASMLSYLLRGLNKPVILTGAQIPLAEVRNDALDNLISSMILAGFHPVPEVCVYFNGRLLRGNRSSKVKATGLDAFDSPNFPWLGQVGLNIELHPHLLLPANATPAFSNPTFATNAVTIVPIYPGISAELLDKVLELEGLQAIILRSYGVGNLPDANPALIASLKRAAERNLHLINISQCLQAEVYQGHYACSAVLNDIGVISGADITLEAAFTKAHYLIATSKQAEFATQFSRSLVGEKSS